MDVQPSAEQVRAAYELAGPAGATGPPGATGPTGCRICPRLCRVDRPAGQTGYCGVGARPIVASSGPHYGEEGCLVGRGGSGAIFLSGCNLLCLFCQNSDISHGLAGQECDPEDIAALMLSLQRRGCENINLVTPTHVTPWLMDAVRRAREQGLSVPIVYNCGGYELVETLRLLEGTVDVYMPDAKFLDPELAYRYTQARDYPDRMRAALVEMQRQVGVLRIEGGIARRGLLVRHLVMPNAVEDSKRVLDFIATDVSPDTYVNVMPQYRPMYKAHELAEIARPVTAAEYDDVERYARELGLSLL